MRSYFIGAVSAFVLMLPVRAVYAQKNDATLSKSDVKYREESEALRKSVWAWKRPEFSNRNIPAEYAKASKIIIARHTDLSADSKSKVAYYGLGFGAKKELTIVETVREMVKLNDKSAVEEFSELSFTRLVKKSGVYTKAKSSAFIGIRVIKPGGKIIEVNADDIVLTKNEADEKKAKVAIPDLQPGDIIDYFITTDQFLTNDFSTKSYSVILFDDAPVMHYSFHGQLGRKYAIDYRSYNGAPDLKVSKNEDDDIVIDVEKKDMPAFETSLWVAPALQLPFIRMQISLGYKGMGSKYLGTSKPGEVNKDMGTDEVLQRYSNAMGIKFNQVFLSPGAYSEFRTIIDDAKKKAKQVGKDYEAMSNDERLAFLYYSFRFTKLLNFEITELARTLNIGYSKFDGMALIMHGLLSADKFDPAILVTTSPNGFRMKEIIDEDDFTSSAYLQSSKKIVSVNTVFNFPFEIPEGVDGFTESRTITLDSKGSSFTVAHMQKRAQLGAGIKIPAAAANKNAHIENLNISITPGNEQLSVNRKTTLKGHYKYDVQKDLILYEDFYESERLALGEKKSLLEILADSRKTKKSVEEVKSAFAEARSKQADAFRDEAKGWFEQEISDLKNHKVEKMGVRHTDPDFVYSSTFNMNGLVKKAGNNMIVEIGKIQGSPLNIKPEQRNRNMDIYMDYPRSIEYDINFEIPAGYTAQGVEALNKNVSNETGFFTAEAKVEGSIVSIKVKKHYLHSFEPAANWTKMMAFLDAAVDWTNAKILLKKS